MNKFIQVAVAISALALNGVALSDPNQWKEIGNYPKAAVYIDIKELPFNKVLLFGGGQWDSSGCNISYNNSVQYDMNTKKLLASKSMAVARSYFSSISLDDGKVLTVGSGNGCTTSDDAKQSEIYNPVTKKWTLGALSTDGFSISGVMRLNNGQILFAGGYWNHSQRAWAELYDQRTSKFTTTGSMNISRMAFASGALIDGKAIVVGGSNASWGNGTEFPGSAETYNPSTGTWSYIADMNIARHSMSGVTLSDGRFLVVGGRIATGVTDTAEIYDPKTDQWTLVAGTLNKARMDHKAVLLLNGDVLIVGGADKDGVAIAETEIFSPATESFKLAGNLNKPRQLFKALRTRNGEVIIAGGRNGSNYVSSIEVFSPAY